MGSVKVKPTLVHDHTVDQWYKYVLIIASLPLPVFSRFARLGPYENEPNITGEIRVQITFEQSKVVLPAHFETWARSQWPAVCTVEANSDSTGFRVPQAYRKGNIWPRLPSQEAGYQTHLCHEGSIKEGDHC